ncbi:carboxylate-amine ligase [Pseudonocardia spinosispora]|uniref:carboxylate-amine ligase n=1 Tax=Pseudonocardia spinosispora TaxID=103441 RepID=UPI0003F4F566|nr:glutamate--cysteine ligase [Pseudonocardia spinosispora]
MTGRTVGVEEEFLLVDPDSGRPRAVAAALLARDEHSPGGEVELELQQQQIETATSPCRTLEELGRELRGARAHTRQMASAGGVEIAAVGGPAAEFEAEVTPSPRYRRVAERFGMTVSDQLTCGCHVHVAVESEDEAVAVLDRIRGWLAPLLALSANSPFWGGKDSEYSSYRSQVWSRWPCSGVTDLFGSARAYRDTVEAMVESGTVLDSGMVYFDARVSENYPTVEIRVADVCLYADDAVLLGSLARGLVDTAARDWAAGREAPPIRSELLKLAAWRAGRSGLDAELVDPATLRPAKAEAVVYGLVDHVRESLEQYGDYEVTRELVEQVLRRGNGARWQRDAYTRTGDLSEMLTQAAKVTMNGG